MILLINYKNDETTRQELVKRVWVTKKYLHMLTEYNQICIPFEMINDFEIVTEE